MKVKVVIFLTCFLAFLLRVWQIDKNPPSLNWDEVSHGYNAYSILKTSRDEWGISFPTIFRAFGDYKLPVYVYLVALSEKIFGLNALGVRFPSILAGTLSVLFTFLLARRLFKKDSIAVLAAFLMAIEPWSLFLSRVAVEANLASFFIIAGAYFFLVGLERREFQSVSLLFFGLSLFTYNSARVFVPLLVLGLFWIYRGEWQKVERRYRLMAGLIFLVFLGGMVISVLSPSGQARYKWVTLIDEGAIQAINQARGDSALPGFLSELIFNKGTYSAVNFAKNYLSYFSPQFLFFKGGSQYQFNIPRYGLICPVQIPFILLGIWYLFKKRKENPARLIFAWLLLAPIAGSLTRDAPHTLRVIVVLPIWQIISAVGLVGGIGETRGITRIKTIVVIGYSLLIIGCLANYWRLYFESYRVNYSWAWQYGYKEAVQFIKDNYDKYDKIIVTKKYGEPHEFILFYWPWDPKKLRDDKNLIRYFQTNWYWVDSFDKFEFVNDWEIIEKSKIKNQKSKILLITSPGNYPAEWRRVETINFLDGKPAFEILEE
jgi:4-amino-4-deoxy-L-arabinose transferase-like glycosyltransferase